MPLSHSGTPPRSHLPSVSTQMERAAIRDPLKPAFYRYPITRRAVVVSLGSYHFPNLQIKLGQHTSWYAS